MSENNLSELFTRQINDYLLPPIDFAVLDRSCNSEDKSYAMSVLQSLHGVFEDIYGAGPIGETICEDGFIFVPAVLQGSNTGKTALGLALLDLSSSGEHWGTFFFTERGVIEQGSEDTKSDAEYIRENFIPYKYWYTPHIPGDIHGMGAAPKEIADMIEHARSAAPEQGMRME
jgi:hypothetical protein